ncbi:MAG: DUF3795 domain-containing protein [Oscillospiraceae bacterium]|nr:DUF3795 domain-containing protein [Oscillospiraceae bacterium]
MEKQIAACGNDCAACPRHLPKSTAELEAVALLWRKIGYRDVVVSPEEIACAGCGPHNWCRYEVIACARQHNAAHCGECPQYPCQTISDAFSATMAFEPACRTACTRQQYEALDRAFFQKRKNLESGR